MFLNMIVLFLLLFITVQTLLGEITYFGLLQKAEGPVILGNGTSVEILFAFNTTFDVDTSELLLEGSIGNKTLLTSDTVFTFLENDTIRYSLSSSVLSGLSYGKYIVRFGLKLTNSSDTKEIDADFVFDAEIKSLEVNCHNFVEVQEESSVNITIHGGYMVNVSLYINENLTSQIYSFKNEMNALLLKPRIGSPGPINVTIVANNLISKVTNSCSILSLYKLHGLSMTNIGLFQTTENATFVLEKNFSYSYPQGLKHIYIMYGDGTPNESQELSEETFSKDNITFVHNYKLQGNYTVEATVVSYLGELLLTTTVQIWDQLSFELNIPKVIAVDVILKFHFSPIPRSNFQYSISFGDNEETIRNTENDLYKSFDWNVTKKYHNIGHFNISVNVWNPIYNKSFIFQLTVDQPLPSATDVSFFPDYDIIPLPDGIANFTLIFNKPYVSLSDIICAFNFEGDMTNLSIYSVQNFPFTIMHSYETVGEKQVSVSCKNDVSNLTTSTSVTLKVYDIRDITILREPNRDIIPMNMSVIRLHQTNPYDAPFRAEDTPVNVSFMLSLHYLKRLPYNLQANWDFGDGSTATGVDILYPYKRRGSFTCKVTVKDLNKNITFQPNKKIIQLGKLHIEGNYPKGDLREMWYTFSSIVYFYEFVNSLKIYRDWKDQNNLGGTVMYNNQTNPVSSSLDVSGKLQKYGYYLPKFTLRHKGDYEILYLEKMINADYSLEREKSNRYLNLHCNKRIPLPPGYIKFEIRSENSDRIVLPYVNCTLRSGDAVNREIETRIGNISWQNPLVFNYRYIDLGNQSVSITCFNHISEIKFTEDIFVYNPCFGEEGVFDRQYSMKNTPLNIYASQDLYLSNRMSINCPHLDQLFTWTIFQEAIYSAMNIISYNNPMVPSKGTLLIKKWSINPGLYCVELNVSLATTYLREYMFINVLQAKPIAFISGGNKVFIEIADDYQLNALEYLAVNGNENNTQNTVFSWSCKRSDRSVIDFRDTVAFVSDLKDGVPCIMNTTSYGIASLKLQVPSNYRITLNVNMESSFTQTVSYTLKEIQLTKLQCVVNCKDKVAVASKLAVNGVCPNCKKNEWQLFFLWKVYEFKTAERYELLSDSITNATNDTTKISFALQKYSLREGTKYLIVLFFANATSIPYGESNLYMYIHTNTPPRRGTCEMSINDSELKISVHCYNWKKDDEPLVYQFQTVTRRRQIYGNIDEDIINYLYKGSEDQIVNMSIQAGDHVFGYKVQVQVKIFDSYGDYTLFGPVDFLVTAIPPKHFSPADSNDVKSVQNLLEDFENKIGSILRGGNDMRVIRLIGSVASMFNASYNTRMTTTEEEILSGAVTEVYIDDESKVTPVEREYRKVTERLLAILKENIGMNCIGFSHRFSLADIQQIFSTINTFTRNIRYLTYDHVVDIILMSESMIDCFMKVSKEFPLPAEYVDAIYDTATQVHGIFDMLLDKLLPLDLLDDEKEPLERDIYTDLVRKVEDLKQEEALLKNVNVSTLIDYDDLSSKAQMIYRVRNHEYNIQNTQKNITEAYLSRFRETLSKMQDVILRTIVVGERHELNRGVLNIITEKTTIDDVKNTTDDYYIGLQPANDTDKITSSVPVNIKLVVFHKNPFIYGSNASTLTSDVSTFDVGNDIKLDTKLQNKKKVAFKRYYPLINYKNADKFIHFTFEVKNNDDAVIIYLRPDGFEVSGYNTSLDLYNVYIREEDHPTSVSYDILKTLSVRDMTEDGFKIFVRAGVCGKGKCYMAFEPLKVPELENEEKTRFKRDADETRSNSSFFPTEAHFSLSVYTTGCRSWNSSSNSWDAQSCEVLELSNMDETICRCLGSVFSTTFYVPPNLINFLYVWDKFDPSNGSVYGTLLAIFILYIIAACVLRREDRKDIERWRIRFLCDNETGCENFYLLSVYTGIRIGAATKSNVNFSINGDKGDTGIRYLSDGMQKGFAMGSICQFLMGTKNILGDLHYLRIWHDCSGEGSYGSWFLNRIEVHDLQTSERSTFLCNKWLGIDKDDGKIERVLPVSDQDTMTSFNILFSQNTETHISEDHLWLSLVFRPKKTPFNRVQRLSCLLAFLLLTMITNAMFFKTSSENISVDNLQFGFIHISYSSIYISFIGIVITTPPMLLVSILFRKRRMVKTKQKTHNRSRKYDISDSNENSVNLDEFIDNGKMLFPYWTLYVGYVIVFLATTSSAFFLILYSMEWGKSKSNQWLASFALSFFDSVLVCDPLKVIVVATVISTIFKRDKQKQTSNIDIRKLLTAHMCTSMEKKENFSVFAKELMCKAEPMKDDELRTIRKRRQEENKAKHVLQNFLTYMVYISALIGTSFLQRDPRAYSYNRNIGNYLYNQNKGQFGFSAIKSKNHTIKWLKETFIPTLYPTEDAAGRTLGVRYKQWFGDLSSVRVGPPRLRQLRMTKDTCPYKKLSNVYPCIKGFSENEEDTNSYCDRWRPYNHSICGSIAYKSSLYTSESWKYTNAEEIWGVSRTGEFNTYSGGGYIVRFGKERYNAEKMMDELLTRNWINRNTRSLFIEFTLYNPNADLFIYAMFLVEFPETGGAVTWTDVQTFRPLLSLGQLGNIETICYLINIIYFLITTAKIIILLKKTSVTKYFCVPWNCIEFICLFLGYICITFYAVRIHFANEAMKMFYEDKINGKNIFINFSHIVLWDYAFNSCLAILVFLSILQFLRILEYNKRIIQIITVITDAWRDVLGFAVIFTMMFMAFVILGTLLFGSKLKGYRSVLNACGSLTNSFIGKNNLDSLVRASPHAAQIFYFLYMGCVIMTMVTIFVAILNKSISNVKTAISQTAATYGICDHIYISLMKACSVFLRRKQLQSDQFESKKHKREILKDDRVDTANTLLLVKLVLDEHKRGAYQTYTGVKSNNSRQVTKKPNKSLHQSVYDDFIGIQLATANDGASDVKNIPETFL